MGTHALVLNASFEPLNVVSWQRALQLLFQGKVEVIEESDHEIRTVQFSMKIPAVLRLIAYIPLQQKKRVIRFSRINVFLRDHHRCQYCGRHLQRRLLTLDHVIPVVQGGKKCWENIVTACKVCNQRKGGRTPQQAGMRLVKHPVEPVWLPKTCYGLGVSVTPDKWKIYLQYSSKPD